MRIATGLVTGPSKIKLWFGSTGAQAYPDPSHGADGARGPRVPRRLATGPLHPKQIARSATYFVDAEQDPMPRGCTAAWETVKAELTKGVRDWERSRSRGIDR